MNARPRLVYILPNLFTAASIFTGIVSIVKASQGRFEAAAWLIFLSLVFDGLDGRVARLTHTSSRFGVEFDSLADVVAFGTAPAMLLFFQLGRDYGRLGVLVAALFVVFGAIRLARFNVTNAENDPNVFIGLPIPTAAVFVATMSLLVLEHPALTAIGGVLLALALVAALLMVSNIRYPSFKKIDLRRPMMLKTLVVLTLVASTIYLFPAEGLATVIGAYVLYGPLRALRLPRRRVGRG
ncbi:CDP-diacylglycerol--serine O-phosphatidyltransferase [Nitratifractor sp.]